MLERKCLICGKKFYVFPYVIKGGRGKFCSKECQYKAKIKKIERKCLICGKKFFSVPSRIKVGKGKFCSRKCQWKWLSNIRKNTLLTEETKNKIGKANKGKKRTKETIEKLKKAFKGRIHIGKPCSEETKKKISIANKGNPSYFKGKKWTESMRIKLSGANSPHWKGGSSFELYPPAFNQYLKKQIRQRDNYTCQECGVLEKQLKRKLSIHHIDYNKKNNNPDNLISLCPNCHSKTGFNRKDWEDYFRDKNYTINNNYADRVNKTIKLLIILTKHCKRLENDMLLGG